MAQTFYDNHYEVTFFSDLLSSANSLFDWLSIKKTNYDVNKIINDSDLVIVDIQSPFFKANEELLIKNKKVLLTTAKDFTLNVMNLKDCSVNFLFNNELKISHGPVCEDSKSGKSMVECADEFILKKFGIKPSEKLPRVKISINPEKNLTIFPTTPNPKKNYSASGFKSLASSLNKKGWNVTIVCTPSEFELLTKEYAQFNVKSFASIKELIEYLANASLVISNDSGGGHLASMLGIPTVTITRKNKSFLWRPGYENNIVITPIIKFKLISGHIWRPFISTRMILKAVNLLSATNKL